MSRFTNALFLFSCLILFCQTVPTAAQSPDGTEKPSRLREVVVTATKTEHHLEDVPVETLLITREDIEKTAAKTVSDLLDQIPGFNFSQQTGLTGAMGYKNTVRGLNVEDRYLLVLVDGQRIFTGFHSGGMSGAGFAHGVNVIPVSLIDRIEAVKGAGSALYGSDAVSGVINIITRRPPKKTTYSAGAGYGMYETKGVNYIGQTPENKTRKTYQGHATVGGSITDSLSGTLSVSHEGNDGIHPTRYDVTRNYIHSQLRLDVSEALSLRAGAEFTDWKESEARLGDRKTERAPRFWVSGEFSINPLHHLKLAAYHQKLKADFNDPLYGTQWADVRYSDAELQYRGEFLKAHTVTAGLELLREDLDTGTVTDKTSLTKSVYVQDEWSLFEDKVVLVPGIRFDDNEDYGSHWSPKFSAMYAPLPGSKIRASVGWSFKAPLALQTSASPINHITAWLVSNPDLKPEKAITWQIGLEQDFFERRLVLGTTFYHTRIRDMISQTGTDRTMGGLPVITHKNLQKARIQGAEASARLKILEELYLGFGYAHTNARDEKTSRRLPDTPEHTFSGSLEYEDAALGLGGTVSLVHTTAQRNQQFMPTLSARTDPFTTTDLKLWKDFLESGRLSFEVKNLFDRELKGSDTIHAGRSFLCGLEFSF